MRVVRAPSGYAEYGWYARLTYPGMSGMVLPEYPDTPGVSGMGLFTLGMSGVRPPTFPGMSRMPLLDLPGYVGYGSVARLVDTRVRRICNIHIHGYPGLSGMPT